MMNPLKVAATFLVIGAGLIGSYFIIKNSAPTLSAAPVVPIPQDSTGQKLLSGDPIKWIEDAAKSIVETSKSLADLSNSLSQDNSTTTDDENSINLTDLVGQTMFSNLKNLDQSGQNPFQNQNLDPNSQQSQQLIQEAASSIQGQGNLFNPQIEDKDLKISSDNSKEAKTNYLFAMHDAIAQAFKDPSLQRNKDQLFNDVNQDCFAGGGSVNSKVADAYDKAASDNLTITVPSDWSDIHKEIIFNLEKGKLIFKAIANCVADPMKGYLAIQALPQFAAETLATQTVLKKKAADDGLLQ